MAWSGAIAELIVGAPRPHSADSSRVGMRQAYFEPAKVTQSLRVAGPSASRKPIAISNKVASIERIQCEVVCADRIAPAIDPVCESCLAKSLGNPSLTAKLAA